MNIRDVWRDDSSEFGKSLLPGAGFSFRYGGTAIGPEMSADWDRASTARDASGGVKVDWSHQSGLVVTREARAFSEFGAMEYQLRFKNISGKALAPLSAIKALDLSFSEAATDGICVVSSGGGLFDAFLPPRCFAIRKDCFSPTVPDSGTVELMTEGGRSSNKDLPFFIVHNDRKKEGLFVAIGWSGQWAAAVTVDPVTGTLSVKGKIPDLEIALEPDEECQGPTVLVGLYTGEIADGSNRLRRLIRDVYTPMRANERIMPVATYDTWFGVALRFDESILCKLADAAAEIGQEYFLLDAGWYAGCEGETNFTTGLGNWYEVDRDRLPRGLKPVAEYVRSKGLKFGLWFEPERVAEGTRLAIEHADWILWDHGRESESWVRDSYPDFFKRRFGLLDYGHPEVQQWVKELLDSYIRAYDVKYIRYDFNMDPLPYWDANDKPNRRGVTQLRHVQGFYAIIDWITQRHPETVLEGCATGGRRIDLETARRFHTFWISDYTLDPSIIRYHLFGINYFLPGNYSYVQYTLPSPNQKDFRPDDLGFQSLFGGAFGTGGRVDLWPEDMKRKARLHVETWKKIRRYLMEDYYPLSAQPGDLHSWSGWQFHDPKDQSGFVQTFRANTSDPQHVFFLRGVDAEAGYRFVDAYGTDGFERMGAVAMTEGIKVTQEPMSSKIFTYKKAL